MFTSVLVFFHVLFSPMVSTGCGFMAWVACANLPILKQTATTTGIWFFDKIFDVVLNAVPDLSHFDLNFVVVHEHSIPLWFVGAIAVYSLAWSYGSLSISSYFLEGKDL